MAEQTRDELDQLLAENCQDPAFAAVYDDTRARSSLALTLVRMREAAGLSVEEVAARAGLSGDNIVRQLGEYESGRLIHDVPLWLLQAYARAVGGWLYLGLAAVGVCRWYGPRPRAVGVGLAAPDDEVAYGDLVELPLEPVEAGERPWTPNRRVINDEGRPATRITVKRCCNGCGVKLGDATEDEIFAFGRLPDVRGECPTCAPGAAATDQPPAALHHHNHIDPRRQRT